MTDSGAAAAFDWIAQTRVRMMGAAVVVWTCVVLATAGCTAGNFLSVPAARARAHGSVAGGAVSGALCAWHAWRFYEDARHGHAAYSAFEAWRAVHNCKRAKR
jgi:hypothetical protein